MMPITRRQLEKESLKHYAQALLYARRKVDARRRKVRCSLPDPEDLVAEAITRALEGRRKWAPRKQSFFEFLTGIISGMLYDEVRQRSRFDGDDFENVVALALSPEDAAERASEVNGFLRFLANRSEFDLLDLARMIVFGDFDTAAQMAIHLDVPTTEVENRKKRLAAAIKGYREETASPPTAPGGPR